MAHFVSRIEMKFNENYMKMINNTLDVLDGEDCTDEELLIRDGFEKSYVKWYDEFAINPNTLKAASSFYLAIGSEHDALVQCDEQFFVKRPLFFQEAFAAPGVESIAFYNLFDSGVNEETGELLPSDAKSNLWESLNGLGRLATILCIYQKLPVVKEILDLLIMNNPDITPANITKRVLDAFQNDRRMKRLVVKLMNSIKETEFLDIFKSLQRVVSALAGKTDVANVKETSRQQLFTHCKQTLASFGESALCEHPDLEKVFNEILTTNELSVVREKSELHSKIAEVMETEIMKPNIEVYHKTSDLGNAMKDMLAAHQSQDQEKMNSIFAKHFPGEALTKPKDPKQELLERFDECLVEQEITQLTEEQEMEILDCLLEHRPTDAIVCEDHKLVERACDVFHSKAMKQPVRAYKRVT